MRCAAVLVAALLLRAEAAERPNIVFFLTDDQDQVLGASLPTTAPNGATPIPKAKELIMDSGSVADNFYVHTPICCPSRSETFTGRYLHNIKKPGQCPEGYTGTDDDGNFCCMHVDEGLVNNVTMAKYMKEQAGYTVGMFGKYLNVCPEKAQEGFDAWFANGGGTYMAPKFSIENIDGEPDGDKQFGEDDYSTALIGNYSINWIKKVAKGDKPFLAFINPKACHEPFIPAPWYADYWDASWPAGAPRTPNFNISKEERADHHRTIAEMGMISEETAQCIDDTFMNRWRTLMSVDDVINDVIKTLDEMHVLNNTYLLFSSDHGYQLGNMNLAIDKRNVYEFDIKVHLIASGPGIQPGSRLTVPATNVDLAPTILSMAGLEAPAGMDGRSLLPLLATTTGQLPNATRKYLEAHPRDTTRAHWRTSTYHEYYYVGITPKCGQAEPIENTDNNFIAVRHQQDSPFGNILYAEFQNGTTGFMDFKTIDFYELYDMTKDPHQLNNIYHAAPQDLRTALHNDVQAWLRCKGAACK